MDLKTQGARRTLGPAVYKSWGYQLAAYRAALSEARPVQCLNVIMNSGEAHFPVEAPWSEEHIEQCWRAFRAARELWVIEKGYEPAGRPKTECRMPKEVRGGSALKEAA